MISMWVSKVRIEGVRGFNAEAILELGPGLNLLVGKNGAGKTSFLQAIEWCLTGKMKYMEGDEFSREDAIVNLFNTSGVGKVTITLHTPKGNLEVTRRRKRGKSTTRGSSPLTVKFGDKILEDEDAEALLEKSLGMPLDQISTSVFLHQEALRAILSDDPKERSRSIDKMLGMEEVRSFGEALSTKRNMTAAVKQLQIRMETLKRDKVQYAIMTRESVEKARTALIGKGYLETDLDLVKQVEHASAIIGKSSSLKEKLGFPGTIPTVPRADVVSVSKFIVEEDETLRSMDRRRTEALQSVYQEKAQLESLRGRLTQDLEEVRGLSLGSDQNLELARTLENEEASLGISIDDKNRASSALSSSVSALVRAQDRLVSIRSSKTSLEFSISKIEQAVGNEEAHGRLIAEQLNDLAAIEKTLEPLGSLEKLLDSALEYLAEAKSTKCPVCDQPISSENVVDLIKGKMTGTVSREIESLKTRKKTVSSQVHELEASLKELTGLRGQFLETKNRETSALKDAEKETGLKIENDLASQLQSKRTELQHAENEVNRAREKLNQTSSKLREVRARLDHLNNAKKRLAVLVLQAQKELDSKADEKELIGEIDRKVAGVSQLEKELKDTTELDALKKSLDVLEEINNFSKSEVDLDRIEREVPSATALIDSLQRRLSSLKDLEASLIALKEVVAEHEQKTAGGVIESLENSFNRYFQSLDPHDHFKKVRVEIEEGQPPIYSIRALGKEQSTYITTRFSSAQMNAAAIALFLAKHEKVSGELGTILLDDPTQSMDDAHKAAVCKSIIGLLKERQVLLATQDEEVRRLTSDAQKDARAFEFSDWSIKGPVIS